MMRIEIKQSEGKGFTIPIPEFLANNPLSLNVAASKINEHSPMKVSASDLKELLLIVRRYKIETRVSDLLLVDVESSDGDTVKIWI